MRRSRALEHRERAEVHRDVFVLDEEEPGIERAHPLHGSPSFGGTCQREHDACQHGDRASRMPLPGTLCAGVPDGYPVAAMTLLDLVPSAARWPVGGVIAVVVSADRSHPGIS